MIESKNIRSNIPGCPNQEALAKLQRKKRCISSLSESHLEHVEEIWEENLPALRPVGRACLSKRHAKVLTLGAMNLCFQTCCKISLVDWFTCLGWFACKLWICCKHNLYVLLELHLPEGVGFQQRISLLSSRTIGVAIIAEAVGSWLGTEVVDEMSHLGSFLNCLNSLTAFPS